MEILLRLVLLVTRILSWLIYPIFWFISLRKTPKIPPIKNHILLLSATTLADKIRKREIKSETVVASYIARIKEVNPYLNAVVEDRFEEALQEAKNVDAYLSVTDIDVVQLQATQPLLGIPVTVKESCGVRGMSQACGSLAREGVRADVDGVAVSRIRKAGGIILLVSNTPEYCLYWESNNNITGRTNNPYNWHYSAGGSSGGEGALLGAGASILGIGSDVAGSLRLPGLLNGVFAHKCTANLVNTDGHFPNTQSDIGKFNFTIGPMVRYAEDLSLVFKLLAERSEELGLDEEVDMKTLKVFHMFGSGPSIAHLPVDSAIKQAINKCVAYLQHNCGANVDEFKFRMSDSVEIAAAVFFYLEDLPNILGSPVSGKQNDWLLIELMKQLFGCSKYSMNGLIFSLLRSVRGFVLPNRREHYRKNLEELRYEFYDHLDTNGVLLYPTFHTNAYQHNQFIFKMSGVQYQTIFNNLGLPCTNVALGVDTNGLPIGIQVVAGPGQDRLCFAVAKELEKAFGGWQPPS